MTSPKEIAAGLTENERRWLCTLTAAPKVYVDRWVKAGLAKRDGGSLLTELGRQVAAEVQS